MILPKLVFSNFAVRKVRVALTVAAIALSVSLVISVTSGYSSAEAAAFKYLSTYMGTHDATLTRTGDYHGGFDEKICDEILADPDVKKLNRSLEMQSGLLDSTGKPIPGRPADLYGILLPGDDRVDRLTMEAGGWFAADEEDSAVVDQAAARMMKTPDPKNMDENAPSLHVGDSFVLPGAGRQLKLKIVGIVHKPAMIASFTPSIYLPLRTLQKFTLPGEPPQVTRVMIDLKDRALANGFEARWKDKLAAIDPTIHLRMMSQNRSELDKNLEGIHMLSYLGGLVSMTAATFIVFSSLSMGISERQRSLAMLRAIGAFRGQLGRLVIIEGLALSILGVAIGVPLGILWMRILVWRFPDLFAAGISISTGGVLLAVLGSIGAALLASFLPAWGAMRISPLEAMTQMATKSSMLSPILCALAGLVLISLDPLLMYVPWDRIAASHGAADPMGVHRQISFYGHFVLGLPGVMIGWFLLSAIFVWAIEKLAGPLVAAMFSLRYSMLRQQLSGGIWRAAGTCAALMVGLAILVVLQTQGTTMLSGWKLPTKFPDIFIATYKMGGMTTDEQKLLKNIPGVRNGEVTPIAMFSPEFGTSFWSIAGAAVMPDATMFFGIDPDQALKMMELDYRQGDAKSAAAMLKQGRHLIVTQEFHELKGLNIGDKVPLKTTTHGVVDYTIAAVVWSPGIDVIVSSFDMGRQFDQRTAASVFGTIDDARDDFGVKGVYLFAANLEGGVDKEVVMKNVKEAVGAYGMKAGDIRKMKYNIQHGFERLLLLVSTVAFAAMAVASLGVTNTIMASIRSRRWQFGVLRSIGVTRSGLLRLVMAEALLLGVVGTGLGLAAGLEMSIDARQLSRLILGYNPPLVVPWGIILIGVTVVLLIALVASIFPAISAARSEPLDLLQAGRAAM